MDTKTFTAEIPMGFATKQVEADRQKHFKAVKAEERQAKKEAKKEEADPVYDKEWAPECGISKPLFNVTKERNLRFEMIMDGDAEASEANMKKLVELAQIEGALSQEEFRKKQTK